MFFKLDGWLPLGSKSFIFRRIRTLLTYTHYPHGFSTLFQRLPRKSLLPFVGNGALRSCTLPRLDVNSALDPGVDVDADVEANAAAPPEIRAPLSRRANSFRHVPRRTRSDLHVNGPGHGAGSFTRQLSASPRARRRLHQSCDRPRPSSHNERPPRGVTSLPGPDDSQMDLSIFPRVNASFAPSSPRPPAPGVPA